MRSRQLTRVALFVALNVVTAQLSLTLGTVPLTMQTVSVRLAGYLLPVREAALAQVAYVLLGLAGFPVFAGGTGGPQALVSPSFGYLLGFVLMAPSLSLLTRRFDPDRRLVPMLALGLATMPALFVPGVVHLKLLTGMPWREAAMAGFAAFLVPDLVKIALSAALARRIARLGIWPPASGPG